MSAGFTDISSSAQVTVDLVHHIFLRTVYGDRRVVANRTFGGNV